MEKIVSISQGTYLNLLRFYMRLGFIPIKYLNKRKAMRLSKPVVLPGFPKVTWLIIIIVLLIYIYFSRNIWIS